MLVGTGIIPVLELTIKGLNMKLSCWRHEE